MVDINEFIASFPSTTNDGQGVAQAYYVGLNGTASRTIATAFTNPQLRGWKMIHRDNSLWATFYHEDEIIQTKIVHGLSGNAPDFIATHNKKTSKGSMLHHWRRAPHSAPEAVARTLWLVILESGHTELYVPAGYNNDGRINNLMKIHANFPTVDGNVDMENAIAPLDLSALCHTWAVNGNYFSQIQKDITGEGTRHGEYMAVIHARPSNVGISLYDTNGGAFVKTTALASRYSDRYIGRTKSWTEVSGGLSFSFEKKHLKDAFPHVIGNAQLNAGLENMELHFPRHSVLTASNTAEDIFGRKNSRLCGYTVNWSGGYMYRRLWKADYASGHPLHADLKRTKFKEEYTPVQEPDLDWTWVTDTPMEDDDMTDDEKKMVGKWFSGYLQNKIRRGESPSDEEIEFAKRLGIYKGN